MPAPLNLDSVAGLLLRIAPGAHFMAVTPSDTARLASGPSRLYIGGAGNLALKNSSGATVLFVNVPAGTWFPVITDQVMSTATTATNIVALSCK